MPQTREPMASF